MNILSQNARALIFFFIISLIGFFIILINYDPFPFAEEWLIYNELSHYFTHGNIFNSLFAYQSNHIIACIRIIYYISLFIFHSHYLVMILMLIFQIISISMIWHFFDSKHQSIYKMLLSICIGYSLIQYETFLHSHGIVNTLHVASIVLFIWGIQKRRYLAISLPALCIAGFSFLSWMALIPIICVETILMIRQKRWSYHWLAILLMTAILLYMYRNSSRVDIYHPYGPNYDVRIFFPFFLSLLGSFFRPISALTSVPLGIFILVSSLIVIKKDSRPFVRYLLIWGVVAALLLSLGRGDAGITQSFTSRYFTFLFPIWLTLALCFFEKIPTKKLSSFFILIILGISVFSGISQYPEAKGYLGLKNEIKNYCYNLLKKQIPPPPHARYWINTSYQKLKATDDNFSKHGIVIFQEGNN